MKKFVAVVLLHEDKLILQRRDKKAPNNPDTLGFFGGLVEKGENPLQSIKREISEETSLNPEHLIFRELFDSIIPIGAVDSEKGVDTVFLCTLSSASFEVYEGAGVETLSIDELLARNDLAPFSRVIANEIKGRGIL